MPENTYPASVLDEYVKAQPITSLVRRIFKLSDAGVAADESLGPEIQKLADDSGVKFEAVAEELSDPFTALEMRQLLAKHKLGTDFRRDFWERVLVDDLGTLEELPKFAEAAIPPNFTTIRIESRFRTPWNMHGSGDMRSALGPITQGLGLFGLQYSDENFSKDTGDIRDFIRKEGGQKWIQVVRSTDPDRPFFPDPKGINAAFDFADWILHLRKEGYTVEFDE